MAQPVTIALDAMGGDLGAEMVLPGAGIALERRPDIRYLIFGEEPVVRPILARFPKVAAASTFIHCDVTVRMEDKPSQALRSGRRVSSMWRAIEAVKKREADVAVSAGNTGALMAMSKFCLRTLAGIERPAIAGLWPTMRGESVVLDIGATIGADAQQLIDFAMMGGAMARALLDIERPTVGLLNIGVEEVKGLDEIKTAGRLLKEAGLTSLDYIGFVEGDDIGKGTADVIVTEGFTGNIALKTAEGTARQISSYLRAAMGRSLSARIGYLFARGAFRQLREKLDPRRSNGGVFLGLDGIVIKSHGGTDGEGFANAVEVGYSMVRNGLLAKIAQDLAVYHRAGFVAAAAEPSADAESSMTGVK
ncbi:phosphate acyltransferase PlsX [Prosthecomicrobium pneumaticum]|uniref:Phosphate acyltransferase n=1 Tax=Prosthecomicrobium pneumaticum TaxID=81895 RepID=A0A7W9FQ76_9HYPH|nr:phosphate acyltransferase PlsX [Prosthecomicrobium pneumaticum]MBB5754772.1 glycerol-3-phosphate acyltransferase PlsX [Prosthecomicrobium pneumaticum]